MPSPPKPHITTLPTELLSLIFHNLAWQDHHSLSLASPQYFNPVLSTHTLTLLRFLTDTDFNRVQEQSTRRYLSGGRTVVSCYDDPSQITAVKVPLIPTALLYASFAYIEETDDDASGEGVIYARPTKAVEDQLSAIIAGVADIEAVGEGRSSMKKREEEMFRSANVYVAEKPGENRLHPRGPIFGDEQPMVTGNTSSEMWKLTSSALLDDPLLFIREDSPTEERGVMLAAYAFGDVLGMWKWEEGDIPSLRYFLGKAGRKLLQRWRDVYDEYVPGVVFSCAHFDGGLLNFSVIPTGKHGEEVQWGRKMEPAKRPVVKLKTGRKGKAVAPPSTSPSPVT